MPGLNAKRALASARTSWKSGGSILPTLQKYITIPNLSPAFDPRWKESGYMDQVVDLFMEWARKLPFRPRVKKWQIRGRTPVIFIEVPATDGSDRTVLLYGHCDKQPEMMGWLKGLGPWTPVLKGSRLYGRGAADDGYAMFAALTAIGIVKEQGHLHPRYVIIIEASEESGSRDLPAYINKHADQIGTPDLVICMDSGCGDYKRLWMTTSLRGVITGDLTVRILTEGVHSGDATGIVPSSFRIARSLISRIENEETGEILLPDLNVVPPNDRFDQADAAAEILRDGVYAKFPWVSEARPSKSADSMDYILRRTWEAGLEVTGADGFPPEFEKSGNVMRPFTKLRLSMRISPTADAVACRKALHEALTSNPPYGAEVTFESIDPMGGWNAPSLAPWLEESLNRASLAFFKQPMAAMGEGGSIPFMGMLGKKYPNAQFFIGGVLGPHSNAHGPNEFLHLPTVVRFTASIAMVLVDHAQQ